MQHPSQRGNAQSGMSKLITWFCGMLSLLVLFFLAPAFFHSTVGWIVAYVSTNYMVGIEEITQFIWGVCTIVIIFTPMQLLLIIFVKRRIVRSFRGGY